GAGSDIIDGWFGADAMYGGAGDDLFYVDDAGDVVWEFGNQGNDAVYSEVSFSLAGQYIEALFLMCGADIDGTGNSLNNLLVGNCGANTLYGMDGDDEIDGDFGIDTMYGGLGDDTFYVDDDGDTAIEYANEGNDTVISSISYSLAGQYIENLVLQCGDDIDGTGNSLANVLIGNCGDNVLNGMDGNDKIFGDDGYDTLTGGSGADGFYFDTPDDGTYDTITDFTVGTDTINIDMTVFTGFTTEGALDAGAFVDGNTALDADDRILYDSATGELWYDEDGDGALAAVLFAQVTAGTALTAADFMIYDGDTFEPFSASFAPPEDELSGGMFSFALEDMPAFVPADSFLAADAGLGAQPYYAQLPMEFSVSL
ncbi:MAG: calcium-binding protein, partial [Sphingomonas sp.]